MRAFFPILGIAGILLVVSMLMIFFYAPIERQQGVVQKIFYFHVPSAWVAFLAIGIVFLASLGYLWQRKAWIDSIAEASAEVGLVFGTMVLVSGPVWGKPIWGVWWVWDARLTTTLILWLIFVAYVMLRIYTSGGERTARACAVLGIVGALDVPIIHYSVRWWRTLHPQPVMMAKEGVGKGLSSEMVATLLTSLAAFTFLYIALLLLKISVIEQKRRIEALQQGVHS